jgi:hypothetical protein
MGITRVKPDLEAASIVLVGSFNPSIFHPAWLAARELISEEDAEKSEIGVIAEQIAAFRVQWLELQITTNRFHARTPDPSYYPSLGELVRGIFSLLEFTPAHQMGLNRHMHIPVRDHEEWHRLGDMWAPKEAWTGILSGGRSGGLPGVRSLTMEGLREGSSAQFLRVTVAPSEQVEPGIQLSTNEHYEQAKEDSVGGLMRIIEGSWAEAQDFALQVADHLLKESI